jgi:hypothetical protein
MFWPPYLSPGVLPGRPPEDLGFFPTGGWARVGKVSNASPGRSFI